jgi:asparagine synthase (glutamine-hydrolysing)
VSGYAGVVRPHPDPEKEKQDQRAIVSMTEAVRFRGPDGIYRRQVGRGHFAFSYCSTGPAPQEPEQPVSVDGNAWLLGDLRCDGRAEAVQKLEKQGVQPGRDVSGEKLVLTYLETFGPGSLPDLDGDFSLTIWKPQENRLIAFRDLTGHRPFFYAFQDGAIFFSNTMQAVLAVPGMPRELDESFLGDFLLGSPNEDQSRTVYKNIRRLPAGCLLEFSASGHSVRRIANLPMEEPFAPGGDGHQYVDEFRRLFIQAVGDRLPDRDVTILLSGGMDSTSIAEAAAELRKLAGDGAVRNLRAYTVDSRPLYDDDETGLASRLARRLGIPCKEIHSGTVLPFSSGEPKPFALLEPSFDPYSQLYCAYFREIARDSRICLSGGGGDEILRLKALPYLRYLARSRGFFAAASVLMQYVAKHRRIPPMGTGIQARLRTLFRPGNRNPRYPPWLNPAFAERLNLRDRWQRMNRQPASDYPSNPVAYASANDGTVAMILETYDATWTGCPLEVGSPFLDRRLVRFLLRVPTIPWAIGKQLLRTAEAGRLPDEIRLRKKTPLQGDDAALHRASGSWDPLADLGSSPPAGDFVNWKEAKMYLKACTSEELNLHLRPVALAHWLKSVEKGNLFQ